MKQLISKIQDALKHPLPGREAQLGMAHDFRNEGFKIKQSDNPSDASVLILLYQKNDVPHIVLIERTSKNKNDRHAGQISFPGGKHDPDDENFERTALRETNEEVGVLQNDITIIGKLTDLLIPVSNFLVHPFIGFTNITPDFIPEVSEVKSIIEAPLSLFTDPKTKQKTDLILRENFTLKDVPYFNVQGHVLWGATAMMMNEFVELIAP